MTAQTVTQTYQRAKRRRASIVVPVTEEGWETRLYLERVCQRCDGAGYAEEDSPGEACVICYGDGVVPTEAGREFLAFVARWANR